MVTGRDDFVIAFRSAFLKKKDKQKFSLLTLLFLSIFVIILSNLNFKVIKFIKIGINEVVYRSSFLISIPENKIKKIDTKIKDHLKIYDNYKRIEIELETLKQKKLFNDFLKLENTKLRNLINESIQSEKILAKVLIDKDNNILAIDEKPKKPMSNWIITGLYIYDENASNVAKNLSKSERGEYEITDLNRYYLDCHHHFLSHYI